MDHKDSLTKAIQLSKRILDAADQQAWEQVTELEADRVPLIHHYFANSTSINADDTRELKRLNDEIIQQLVIAREKVRTQQMELEQSSRASMAYLEIASE